MILVYRKFRNPFWRFTALLLFVTCAAITSITVFIIDYTFTNEPGSEAVLDDAINWQAHSKGVLATRVWQAARLKNAQTEFALANRGIDTLILGSSSLMGVRDYMLPDDRAVFNGAKNANPLNQAISEAIYYTDKFEQLKWILIGFDWALGYPYSRAEIGAFDPDYENSQKTSILRKIRDAVSYQRVKVVLSNILNSFRHQDGPYNCPKEENLGMDLFKPPFPRTCRGYRYDGSATFSDHRGLTEGEWRGLLKRKGLKIYTDSLASSEGVLNNAYLAELAKIDRVLKSRGGGLEIVIPPLMPQVVSTIEHLEAGAFLNRTLVDLSNFSTENDLAVADASRSEQFGCVFDEFLDPHHAFDRCYSKIFGQWYQ